MAFIKSALELALEKSADIKVDKTEIRQKEVFNSGRALGAKALSEGTEFLETELKTQKKAFKGNEEKIFLSGIAETFLARLTLTLPDPKREVSNLLPLVERILGRKAQALLEQAADFLLQYSEEIRQLKDAINQQLGPQLKQRAQQIAQQTGSSARYVMEKDPQYIKVLNQNLDPLKAHYTQGLDVLKNQLRELL